MEKIKNIEQAAERIREAVKNKERIILYGDSDMDGIASTVLLEETIKNLGGEIDRIMFPDRENDGYGVNKRALELLKDLPAQAGKALRSGNPASQEFLATRALFITMDLGIGNVKEVDIANEYGFQVIIIDHHQILNKIPNAQVVVDPQQEGDEYPFKELCNAGITFKLCKEILGNTLSENLENSFLELTALATIADMVPQVQENKIFIEKGLRSLKNTFRPGLRVFLDILGSGEVVSGGYLKVISAFNAAESIDFNNMSHELLTCSSYDKCRELAETLLGKVQYKQIKIREIVEEVERRIVKNPDQTVIFEGDPAWKLTLAGPVASIIASKYEKPTFIFKKGDTESCGSVRSLKEGQNSVDAMKSCSDILITYGGHPKASGFRVKTENLEAFKNRLEQYFINLKS